MNSRYGIHSWLSTRRGLSTLVGAAGIGGVTCYISYNVVIPLSFFPSHRPWMLALPMLTSIGLAVLVTVNIIPEAPHWEIPLLKRTKFAHGFLFLAVSLAGSIGPVLAGYRLHEADERYPLFLIFFFYIFSTGITCLSVIKMGKNLGPFIAVGLISTVIFLEQAFESYNVISDSSKSNLSKTIPLIVFTFSCFENFKTGGHDK